VALLGFQQSRRALAASKSMVNALDQASCRSTALRYRGYHLPGAGLQLGPHPAGPVGGSQNSCWEPAPAAGQLPPGSPPARHGRYPSSWSSRRTVTLQRGVGVITNLWALRAWCICWRVDVKESAPRRRTVWLFELSQLCFVDSPQPVASLVGNCTEVDFAALSTRAGYAMESLI